MVMLLNISNSIQHIHPVCLKYIRLGQSQEDGRTGGHCDNLIPEQEKKVKRVITKQPKNNEQNGSKHTPINNYF